MSAGPRTAAPPRAPVPLARNRRNATGAACLTVTTGSLIQWVSCCFATFQDLATATNEARLKKLGVRMPPAKPGQNFFHPQKTEASAWVLPALAGAGLSAGACVTLLYAGDKLRASSAKAIS